MWQVSSRPVPLGRGVAVAAHERVHHQALARSRGGQRHMAALARDRHPAASAVGQQPRHTQAGARPQQGDRRAGHGRATADLAHFVRGQVRQGQGQRGEVVEHAQRAQPQAFAQRLLRERPIVVGHAHEVARDRVGHGDRCRARLAAQAIEVDADRGLEAGVFGHRQHLQVLDRRTGAVLPGQAGIGAADVGQQAAGWGG
jgi:hypothetical protein